MATRINRRGNIFIPKNGRGWVGGQYVFVLWVNGKKKIFRGYGSFDLTAKLKSDLQAALDRHGEGLPIVTQGVSSLLREHLERLGLVRVQGHDQLTILAQQYADELTARNGNGEYAGETKARLLAVFAGCEVTKLAELDAAKIGQWVGALQVGRPNKRRAASATTRKAYVIALRSFGKWLEFTGASGSNPLGKLVPPNNKGQETIQRRVLSDDEKSKLLKATAVRKCRRQLSSEDRVILYSLAMATGLRAAELAALTPARFDFQHKCVRLTAAETKNAQKATLPLHKSLLERLKQYVTGKPANDRLWPGYWYRRAAEMLRDDLKAADIPYKVAGEQLDFHALRHTYCTAVTSSGVDLKTAMALKDYRPTLLTRGCRGDRGLSFRPAQGCGL